MLFYANNYYIFVGYALILEHSFFLYQQNVQDPLATAAEQYASSGVSAQVSNTLAMFYPKYKPQQKEKNEMFNLIMNLISEHIICKL